LYINVAQYLFVARHRFVIVHEQIPKIMMMMIPYKKCSFFNWTFCSISGLFYGRAVGEGLNTMDSELLRRYVEMVTKSPPTNNATWDICLNDSNFNSNSETESDSKANRKRDKQRPQTPRTTIIIFFWYFMHNLCDKCEDQKKSEKCSRALIIMLIAWPNCWILWKGQDKATRGERETETLDWTNVQQ